MQQKIVVSTAKIWIGRVISTFPVLALGLSAIAKIARIAAVLQGMARYGYQPHLATVLGAVELLVTMMYVIPRTFFLGAILVTGYLERATATNVPRSCICEIVGSRP